VCIYIYTYIYQLSLSLSHRPDRSIPVKRERPDVYISKLDQTQTDLSRAKGYGGGGIGVEEEMRGVG